MTHEQLQYFLLGALTGVAAVLLVILLDYRLYLRRYRRGAAEKPRTRRRVAATVRHHYDHPPWGRCDCPSEAYHAKYFPAADG